ncbi:MAG TPA: subclass B3 metallo-beta-lactamase [Pyrinomonadaceae bacterium]|jgi:metallo-beta-lactamase class B|nr:subclass B3 metallo-beta-lactamase [Pyrinomonadaceae bacterium]
MMDKWTRGVCVRLSAGLLLTLLCLARAAGQASEEARSWNQPVEPYRIIGNVYYVGASDVTSFLIVTPAGHILLDSGFAETVPLIRRNVARLGFRVEDIKILINSQAHYDHAGGLAQLKRETGARLAASEADAALLAAGGRGDFHFGDRFAYEPVKADRTLRDGDRVRLGGVTMTARLTPGHTKGCTTWTMRVKEGRRFYDVVFVGSTTVPGYKLVGNPNYPGIVSDYVRTFRVMKRLPCDVFLASHGNFYSMLEKAELLARGKRPNPFIDRRGYRSFLAKTEKAFLEQVEREKSGGRGPASGL